MVRIWVWVGHHQSTNETRYALMGLAIVLIVLALLIGGVGLLVKGLTWALIIALVLLVAGAFTGYNGRRTV
jgi:hypothetical protein